MLINQFLVLAAVLFAIGVYGVIVRRNGVLVLMSIELILNSVNINLVAFSAMHGLSGQVFALFVIAVAAAEVAARDSDIPWVPLMLAVDVKGGTVRNHTEGSTSRT